MVPAKVNSGWSSTVGPEWLEGGSFYVDHRISQSDAPDMRRHLPLPVFTHLSKDSQCGFPDVYTDGVEDHELT